MNLKLVQAELAGLGFKTVEGVAALSEFAGRPGATPAAYVIAGAESTTDAASGSGVFEQVVSAGFTVVVVTATGGAIAQRPIDELDVQCSRVISALFGWQHPDSERPTAYAGATEAAVGSGYASRQLRFRTVQRLRMIA